MLKFEDNISVIQEKNVKLLLQNKKKWDGILGITHSYSFPTYTEDKESLSPSL